MSDRALEQCVDLELSDRSSVEIACAYRALCAAILLRTAMVTRSKVPPRKQEIDQKKVAIGWADGEHGIITFGDACEAVGLDPGKARKSMWDYATGQGKHAISRENPVRHRSRTTFSRKNRNAPRPADVPVREAATSNGVDARTPNDSGHCRKPAWA